MRFHRADFHGALLSHLSPSCKTHASKKLVSCSQPAASSKSPIMLTFSDGSSSSCDLLIGADGIKSVVRGHLMREVAQSLSGQAATLALSCVDPIWSGVTAYRSLIDADKLRACAPQHRALREPIIVSWISPIFLVWEGSTDALDLVLREGCGEFDVKRPFTTLKLFCSSSSYTRSPKGNS